MKSLRWIIPLGILLLIGLILGRAFIIPSCGLERNWRRFISAVDDRDLAKMNLLIADDYQDIFEQDKPQLLGMAQLVFKQFVLLDVHTERTDLIDLPNDLVVIQARVQFDGQGSPLAQAMIQGSKQLAQPTGFTWRHESWKPWDWKLVSIKNEEVRAQYLKLQRELDRAGKDFSGYLP